MSKEAFFLISSDGTTVEVHPEWSYTENVVSSIRHSRTVEAELNSYRHTGNYLSINVPLTNVSCSDQLHVSSWWQVQESIYFVTQISSGTYNHTHTRIANRFSPFDRHTENIYDQFDGGLKLKIVSGITKISGYPFTLDSSSYGLLGKVEIVLG